VNIRRRPALMALATALAAAACAHSEPYQPKTRSFEAGEYVERTAPKPGSLYALGSQGLVEDDRPSHVGDVIIIRVDESDSASHDSSTKLDRKSDTALGFSGALEKISPKVDLKTLFGAESQYALAGSGQIQRRGQITASLPVRVKRTLPNGDLYVEGTKVVVVGGEERHLYVSGVVRPADVLGDGSVASSRIADAEIEYTGSGDASDQQKRGWMSRVLGWIWPF
jgi:flagellar L-ring protein FlgH